MDPKKLKVSELREELIRRGLDANGVKQDLIQRLQVTTSPLRISQSLHPSIHQVALDEEEFGISADPALTAILPPTSVPIETKSAEFESSEFVDEPAIESVEVDDSSPKDDEPVPEKVIPAEEKKVEISPPAPEPNVKPTQKQEPKPQAVESEVKPKTESEKRASRAAKFGIQKNDSEVAKDKLAARAERFGLSSSAESSLEEKKRARAERFGLADKKEESKEDSTKTVSRFF